MAPQTMTVTTAWRPRTIPGRPLRAPTARSDTNPAIMACRASCAVLALCLVLFLSTLSAPYGRWRWARGEPRCIETWPLGGNRVIADDERSQCLRPCRLEGLEGWEDLA